MMLLLVKPGRPALDHCLRDRALAQCWPPQLKVYNVDGSNGPRAQGSHVGIIYQYIRNQVRFVDPVHGRDWTPCICCCYCGVYKHDVAGSWPGGIGNLCRGVCM